MYYILTREELFRALSADPFEARAHDIDDTHVILLAQFRDHGHRFRFESRPTVEPLPDARSGAAISDDHVAKLAKYGVQKGHRTIEVSECLAKVAGHYMRLP